MSGKPEKVSEFASGRSAEYFDSKYFVVNLKCRTKNSDMNESTQLIEIMMLFC